MRNMKLGTWDPHLQRTVLGEWSTTPVRWNGHHWVGQIRDRVPHHHLLTRRQFKSFHFFLEQRCCSGLVYHFGNDHVQLRAYWFFPTRRGDHGSWVVKRKEEGRITSQELAAMKKI